MTKICDERPVECDDPACPCHEWSAKSPSDASGPEDQPAGFLVLEPKNVLERDYAQSSPIPEPNFERRWTTAPECRKRYTEKEEAEYWFLEGLVEGIQIGTWRQLEATNRDLQRITQRMR